MTKKYFSISLLTFFANIFSTLQHPGSDTLQKKIDDFYETQIPDCHKCYPDSKILLSTMIKDFFNQSKIINIETNYFKFKKIIDNNLEATPLNKATYFFSNIKNIDTTSYIFLFILTNYPDLENKKTIQNCLYHFSRICIKINWKYLTWHSKKKAIQAACKIVDVLIEKQYPNTDFSRAYNNFYSILNNIIYPYEIKEKQCWYSDEEVWYEDFGLKMVNPNTNKNKLIYLWTNLPDSDSDCFDTRHYYLKGLIRILTSGYLEFKNPRAYKPFLEKIDLKPCIEIPSKSTSFEILETIIKNNNPNRLNNVTASLEKKFIDPRIIKLIIYCLTIKNELTRQVF